MPLATELKTIGVRLEPALLELLRQYSSTYDRSLSSALRLIARDHLVRWRDGHSKNATLRESVSP